MPNLVFVNLLGFLEGFGPVGFSYVFIIVTAGASAGFRKLIANVGFTLPVQLISQRTAGQEMWPGQGLLECPTSQALALVEDEIPESPCSVRKAVLGTPKT